MKTPQFLSYLKRSHFPQQNFILYIDQLALTLELATHIFICLPDQETGKLYWEKSLLICIGYVTIEYNVKILSIENVNCNSDLKKSKITQKYLHKARSLKWVNICTFQTLQALINAKLINWWVGQLFWRRNHKKQIWPSTLCIDCLAPYQFTAWDPLKYSGIKWAEQQKNPKTFCHHHHSYSQACGHQ